MADAAETFRQDGILDIPAVITSLEAAAMVDAVWRRIEAHSPARRHQRSTWRGARLPSFKPLKRRAMFEPLIASPNLASALDDIFGSRQWEPSGSGVQVLFTFPNADTWVLPHHFWHMDTGFGPAVPTASVKMFCCIDAVEPGGGGTLAMAGSHRLVDRYSATLPDDERAANTASMRRFLNRDPWARTLIRPGDEPTRTQQFMEERHDADGIELRIIEMTGQPGGAYITDIHTLHCVAPNASDRPRIMLGAVYGRIEC